MVISLPMDDYFVKKELKEQGAIGAELLQEMAEALGNTGERLEQALQRLRESSDRVSALKERMKKASEPGEELRLRELLNQEIHNHNVLRTHAMEQLRWLIIHREALGIRNHALVHEQYKIPPPLSL